MLGAILAFALNVGLDWIDLTLVGYLLMGAGALTTIIGIVLFSTRRSTVVHEETTHRDHADHVDH